MEENKRPWIKWLVATGIALLIAFIFIAGNRGFSGTLSEADMAKVISDGFFVSGVLVCGSGLMIFVSRKGSFDILAFSVKAAIRVIFKKEDNETYYDYKQRKAAEDVTPCAHLIVPGAVMLLISVIYVAVFYQK